MKSRKIGIIGLALMFALVNVLAVEGQEIPNLPVYQTEYTYLKNSDGEIFRAKLVNRSFAEQMPVVGGWIKIYRNRFDKDQLVVLENKTENKTIKLKIDLSSLDSRSQYFHLKSEWVELLPLEKQREYQLFADNIPKWWENKVVIEKDIQDIIKSMEKEPVIPRVEDAGNIDVTPPSRLDTVRSYEEQIIGIVNESDRYFYVHAYAMDGEPNRYLKFNKTSDIDYNDKEMVLAMLTNTVAKELNVRPQLIYLKYREEPSFNINVLLPYLSVILLLAIALFIVYDRWRKR